MDVTGSLMMTRTTHAVRLLSHTKTQKKRGRRKRLSVTPPCADDCPQANSSASASSFTEQQQTRKVLAKRPRDCSSLRALDRAAFHTARGHPPPRIADQKSQHFRARNVAFISDRFVGSLGHRRRHRRRHRRLDCRRCTAQQLQHRIGQARLVRSH